ncbi:HD domain-containing phosphohydrolase [Marinobacter sp. CHS3-4]|uniref:HD domain-containing phosphohydrolase n=1 Tax=Marinobacter sp. CHS3-4 TaxID=3045174 RepID=UPI0024B5435B|nr:HD domain-containing phosphohydrolase [Marinobacter sp. CHS3-4]MDI9246027.1 HD domain-containing phosphohydrolase [Marinobacter sp. CHS3-4]
MPSRRSPAQFSLAVLIASTISLGMLILAIVLVGQSFRGMETAKLKAASAAAHQLAISVDDRIQAIIQPPATALTILSHDSIAWANTIGKRLDRLPMMADVLTGSNIVSAVYVGYDNGDFFLLRVLPDGERTEYTNAPPGSRYLLQTITTENPQAKTREYFFYNRRWELLARQVPEDYDYDPRLRGWFQAATEPGRNYLSPPYEFFTTGETGLTLSRRSSSAMGAVFGIDVTITDLNGQLENLRQTPGTEIAILSDRGDLLAHTGSVNGQPAPILAELLERTRSSQSTSDTRYFEVEDRQWWGETEPLYSLDQKDHLIAVAIPSDELLADVWATLKQQTVLASAIALILLGTGWILGRQLGRPLELLADRVGALSKFQFSTSLKLNSHIREARHLSGALDDMASTIRSFQNITTVLNRGQDLNQLLHDVLQQIVQIIGQKRGAVYLANGQEQKLVLSVDQGLAPPAEITGIGGEDDDSDVIQAMRAQCSGHPVFAILRNRSRKLIGALVIEMERGDQTQLTDELIVFVDEIAGSAAVAIETRELIETQQALLEGFIRLVAGAIDAKSPYTGGHCERVPRLAQMMVDEAIVSNAKPFANFSMTDDEMYEFHLAAWLHDCGKITSPEYVVDKGVKLETIYNRIHEIRTRFEVLHRDAEIRYLQRCLSGDDPDQAAQDRDAEQQALQEEFQTVANANTGGEFMDDKDIDALHAIARRSWQRHFSDRLGLSSDEQEAIGTLPETPLPAAETLLADQPHHVRPWGDRRPPVTRDDPANRWGFDMDLPEHAANGGELYNLTIRRGTLTPEERFRINDHIVQTICMLGSLPLPDWLARVPHLAGTHHERMDGKGYPCRLTGEQMGVPERIMAIADVFEALTAVDRPYKEGKTLTQSLTIMKHMVNEGHLDRDVFHLFIQSGTYRRYAEQFLRPDQQDNVDESQFLD